MVLHLVIAEARSVSIFPSNEALLGMECLQGAQLPVHAHGYRVDLAQDGVVHGGLDSSQVEHAERPSLRIAYRCGDAAQAVLGLYVVLPPAHHLRPSGHQGERDTVGAGVLDVPAGSFHESQLVGEA